MSTDTNSATELLDTTGIPEDVVKYIEELEKANMGLADKLTEIIEKMPEDGVENPDNSDNDGDSDDDGAIEKADPEIRAFIEKQERALQEVTKRAEAAEEVAKQERDARLTREYVTKAGAYGAIPTVSPGSFGLFLKSAAEKLSEQEFLTLTTVLDASAEVAKSSGLFVEKGSTGGMTEPTSEIEKAAAKLMADDHSLDKFSAIAKAVSSNPSLYDQEH